MHSVVSWTVQKSNCVFSVTIAGFPVLDSAIGNWFLILLYVFTKLYVTHMPKFSMPTSGNGQNDTKIACICLYRIRFPTCIGIHGFVYVGAIFSAVDIKQTSCRDSARLWSPGGEVSTRSVKLFSGTFYFMPRSVEEALGGGGGGGGDQRVSLPKCANLVIARTD